MQGRPRARRTGQQRPDCRRRLATTRAERSRRRPAMARSICPCSAHHQRHGGRRRTVRRGARRQQAREARRRAHARPRRRAEAGEAAGDSGALVDLRALSRPPAANHPRQGPEADVDVEEPDARSSARPVADNDPILEQALERASEKGGVTTVAALARRASLLDSPGTLAYNRAAALQDLARRVGASGRPHANAGIRRRSMNKQELIAKIAKDTGHHENRVRRPRSSRCSTASRDR